MPAMTVQEITKCQKNKTPVRAAFGFCPSHKIGTCLGYKEDGGIILVLFKSSAHPNEEVWIPVCDVKVATEEQIAEWNETRLRDAEFKAKFAIEETRYLKARLNQFEMKQHKHWWSWK